MKLWLMFSAIQSKYDDWKDFLVKRLTGARTLPRDFYKKVQESLYNHPLKKGIQVEVVDKNCVSAMRVANVGDMFGGRLRLEYVDSTVLGIHVYYKPYFYSAITSCTLIHSILNYISLH